MNSTEASSSSVNSTEDQTLLNDITAFVNQSEEDIIIKSNIEPVEEEVIPVDTTPKYLSYHEINDRFNFEMSQHDMITFSEEIRTELWNDIKLFLVKFEKASNPKHFKIHNFYLDTKTKVPIIEFYCTKPDQILNILLLWFCRTQSNDDNVVLTLFCRSSIVCSTASAREHIRKIAEIRMMADEGVKLAKEDGKTITDHLNELDTLHDKLNDVTNATFDDADRPVAELPEDLQPLREPLHELGVAY